MQRTSVAVLSNEEEKKQNAHIAEWVGSVDGFSMSDSLEYHRCDWDTNSAHIAEWVGSVDGSSISDSLEYHRCDWDTNSASIST